MLDGNVIHTGSLLEEGIHQKHCFGIRSGVDCFSILEGGLGRIPPFYST